MFSSAVDIISAIEFDKSGDHLATGDRGGRVVLFERTDTKDVCCFSFLRVSFLNPDISSLLFLIIKTSNYLYLLQFVAW